MISYDLIKEVFDLDNPLTLEYFELCSTSYEGKGEKHHILPRSIWPDYVSSKWNIVNLSYQQHFRSHEILSKICLNQHHQEKMVKSWWIITNRFKGEFIDAETYATLRAAAVRSISEMQKGNKNSLGVKRTDAQKLIYSETKLGDKNHMFGKFGAEHPRYGSTMPEELKQKLIAINTGKTLTEEHKQAIGKGNLGKVVSAETKLKLSQRQLGELNHNWGKTASIETRLKMSESHSGVKNPLYGIPRSEEQKKAHSEKVSKYSYEQYTLGGEFVRVFLRASDLDESGFSRSRVGAVCNGESSHHKGYVWKKIPKVSA